ncbi:RodZ domain-containing protein [Hazenella coriacea]|uniref:Cytoskeletal protein RodZ n=1 Tax=Hazenella coriacea TaxID=1179467 RepID=A0A4R3L064_9BACL|nr:RodZ domain-containing protein [Hazenella coriacea]TCS92584.1 cytoskeletal protein RodZ [Hazenella coriacea]
MTGLQKNSLREARLKDSISIEEISEELNIDSIYLEAIENEEFSTLPSLYAKGYIRTYARFLEVDPNPLLQAYKDSMPKEAVVIDNENSTPPLSRKERAELHQSKRSSSSKKKWMGKKLSSIGWPIWSLIGLIILAIPLLIWWLSDDNQTVVHSVNPSTTSSPSDAKVTSEQSKSTRAEVKLIQPSETYDYGDVYGISQSDQVQVKVTAVKPTEIRVRESGPQGKIIFEKELQSNQVETFTHDQWISLRVNHPSHVLLSVNGVTIDTSEQKEIQVYQLKVVDGAER